MSDNPTQQIPDSRSFEERVFARFDALDARMDSFESRLDSIETKVDRLDGRLTALEEKVDSRLRETRPIWEAMQADLEDVKNRLGVVEKEVKDIGRGVVLLHKDFFQVRKEQEELRERVEKLESPSAR